MTEQAVIGKTLPEAYHNALQALRWWGDKVPCPAYHTNCLECGMTMIVEHPLQEPLISKLFPGGPGDLQQYTMEIRDGILDFEVDRGNWEYTYHRRIGDQTTLVIRELKRDPNSRRAVIDLRRISDALMDDPPCLQHIQFFIRDGKLDMSVLFRSNDAFKATFMNAYALIALQCRAAKELGVEVGTYTHRANSFHVYERDWDALNKAVTRIERGEELTYNLKGDWGEMMIDAVPDILAKVEELKRR